MTDIVDKKTRSRMMSGIRGKDTKPEFIIRRGLHRAGFRYRLHSSKFPGKPDLALQKYNALILVNGCFWHGHQCHLFNWPGGPRETFWREKIENNVARDRRNQRVYEKLGWRIAIVWECALKGKLKLDSEQVINSLAEWICGSEKYLNISSIGTNKGS